MSLNKIFTGVSALGRLLANFLFIEIGAMSNFIFSFLLLCLNCGEVLGIKKI